MYFYSKGMSKLSAISIACTVMGTSLLGMILIGPVNAMDHKNIKIVCDCAFCLLTAAVVLGIIAILFSILRKDSVKDLKQSRNALKNRIAKQDSQGSSGDSINKFPNKRPVTSLKDDGMKMSNTNYSKSMENTAASSKVSEKGETDKNMQKRSALLETRKQCPVTERQLVPVKKHPEALSLDKFRTNIPCQAVEQRNFFSTNNLTSSPVSEVVATRTMRVLPDGNVQEEYQIKQTFYRYPGAGMGYQQSIQTNLNQQNQEKPKRCLTSQPNHVSDVISKLESFNF